MGLPDILEPVSQAIVIEAANKAEPKLTKLIEGVVRAIKWKTSKSEISRQSRDRLHPKSGNSALEIAKDIQRKARDIGFDWKTIDGVFDKVNEELKELKKADKRQEKEEELGDLLFTVLHLANFLDIDAEESLRKTCLKFEKRFKKIEKAVKGGDALSFKQMDKIWAGIKSEGI